MIKGASSSGTAATTAAMRSGPMNISLSPESEFSRSPTALTTTVCMCWVKLATPGGVVVECGLTVCSGVTLRRFGEILEASVSVVNCIAGLVVVVGCVVGMTGCGMGVEVVRMSMASSLVSVLVEGSPLSVDCSIVVVDVCCSVSLVLLVVELVVVVSSVVLSVKVSPLVVEVFF